MPTPSSRVPALATLLAVAVLAGCSTLDVPRADNYPATGQKKARAVHHWDVLAEDVAVRIAQKIADWPAGEHPIHITGADDSSFNQGFLKLLRVRLLDKGVTLSTVPTAVELEIQTQVVQHQAAGPRNLPVPLPLTMLGAGVGVWRDWETHYANRSLLPGVSTAIGLGAGLALDMARMHTQGLAAGGPTHTEVLVTTALKTSDRYLAGSADMYYIERADTALYQPERLVPPPPTPVKQWKVVAP
ncbi:MAG TPA: hypothetical protein DET46_08885 [Comamonadaceae bacterium]|nr:MAG: hypothetical protein A3F76_07155 [Burkholderiales bacterium RIFCSPLOWO2_12_FULL_65_40]HCE28852.1 hypothetical protein [Comamonadaceae bacterium]